MIVLNLISYKYKMGDLDRKMWFAAHCLHIQKVLVAVKECVAQVEEDLRVLYS